MVVTTPCAGWTDRPSTGMAHLGPEVIVGDRSSRRGYVLAVRILHDKSTYNTSEM
jgi:hypothetical protein